MPIGPVPAGQIPVFTISENFFHDINVLETVINMLGAKFNDFSEPLRAALHEIIIPSVAENFARQGRPPWSPLAPSTVVSRGNKTGPILYRTGKLEGAATDPSNWTVTRDFLALTNLSSVSYAGYHQMGAPRANIPARPFVEFQPEDVDAITELFGIWVDKQVAEVWGFGEGGPV